MSALVEQIQAIREERDRLRERLSMSEAANQRERFAMEAEVQKWKDDHGLVLGDRIAWQVRAKSAEEQLAALRARVKEWIAARDKSGGLDPLGGDQVEWIAACKAADFAEAALRTEVEK